MGPLLQFLMQGRAVQGPPTVPQIYRAYEGQQEKPTDVDLPFEVQKDISKTKAVEQTKPKEAATLFAQDTPRYGLQLREAFPNLPDVAIAGILGNFGHETGGFKYTQEGKPISGRGGLGLPQFTGPRRVAFENYLTEKYGEIPTESTVIQDESLNYAIQELKRPEYANLLKKLENSKTLKDAVVTFEKVYEKAHPFKKGMSSRLLYAKQAENLLKEFKR